MSYRDTRIFICDFCGREEEGQLTRAESPDGKLFFELPVGWNLLGVPSNAIYCDECAVLFSEFKLKVREAKQ